MYPCKQSQRKLFNKALSKKRKISRDHEECRKHAIAKDLRRQNTELSVKTADREHTGYDQPEGQQKYEKVRGKAGGPRSPGSVEKKTDSEKRGEDEYRRYVQRKLA